MSHYGELPYVVLLKNDSQIFKMWQFLWYPHLVTLKSTTKLPFFVVFEQFLAENCSKTPKIGSRRFWCYQNWPFTKIAKSWLFDCFFWRSLANFGKTTSGSSPKQDNLTRWLKQVWLPLTTWYESIINVAKINNFWGFWRNVLNNQHQLRLLKFYAVFI